MAWAEKAGDPDIRRNTFPVTVQRSGGNVVTENMIIDQNIKTGNYVVYKKNLVGGEVIVIQSNKDQNDGLFKITSGPGAQLSPIGIDPKDYEKFVITSLPDISDEQRKNYFQNNGPQLAASLGVPGFRGAANPNPPTSGGGQTPYLPTSPGGNNKRDPLDTTVNLSSISQINPEKENPTFTDAFGRSDLVYPTNIRNNGQDFIKFTIIKYTTRTLDVSGSIGILGDRPAPSAQNKEIKGNIILPIQPSISDTNNVDWNGLGINPLEMELTNGSLNLMSGSGQAYLQGTPGGSPGLIDRLSSLTKDPNVISAVKLYFAQKAAGVNGVLSRVTGAEVNPNLELLFQGPTLRPFDFRFNLSPRSESEAKTVRNIIRAFKQYSAVGTASGGLFLTAPNIFNIQYITKNRDGKEQTHKSLNRIKTCALKSVSVDYTPDNSYMTFSDDARTMVSYNISLQFQELEPVTTSDYIDKIPYNEIGY